MSPRTPDPAADDPPGDVEAHVDEDDVAARAHLRASERHAGSDDPRRQAEAILEEGEERRIEASLERDPDSDA